MKRLIFLLTIALSFGLVSNSFAAGDAEPAYHKGEYDLKAKQYAEFPIPLGKYEEKLTPDGKKDVGATLKYRAMQQNGFNLVASIIFVCAILHTFLAGFFMEMAHKEEHKHKIRIKEQGRTGCAKPHEGAKDDVSFKAHLFHFLGEVEAIFGIWVIALVGAILWFFGIQPHGLAEGLGKGFTQISYYLGKDVNFTEPLFVVIVMAIAATRPVVRFAESIIGIFAKALGNGPAGWWIAVLTVAPILGSFITEPAAMTIAAMILSKRFFDKNPPTSFAYATLGLLFVNISVGGTLTHFAAPPVLMVAEPWKWNLGFMFVNFGWKAVIGIFIANAAYFTFYKKHFAALASQQKEMNVIKWIEREDPIPAWITVSHLFFLGWTVFTLHYPVLFLGGFMFFLAFTQATGHHQNEVSMKTPILVGFFLAGLVIHGKCQAWWIEPLITSIDNKLILMIGATLLTAFNDNAAITYLASQAPGLSAAQQYAVVAGAVTGGGLTVIANAPNPAGQSLLGKYFKGGVAPAKLAAAAIIPTIIMGTCFMVFPSKGMKEKPKAALEAEKKGKKDGKYGDKKGEMKTKKDDH